jgi:hypothetical protein
MFNRFADRKPSSTAGIGQTLSDAGLSPLWRQVCGVRSVASGQELVQLSVGTDGEPLARKPNDVEADG